ncbi:K+/H+ antiporter subunit F [Shimia ponticola]|uniref:K+/H+ antiporter subunit F n=1 Tax=Shimia ponticola TaxID=2582893 RepID=UPI0011BE6B45|nr:K+/H+ antiporter subunit F [Shimia ponticola]
MIDLFNLPVGDGPGATFLAWSVAISFAVVVISQILAMVRVAVGPGSGDRILALDTMVVNAIALIVLLGISQGTSIYFEASLIIAMLGFVSTVALARFILRGDIIE